MMNLIDSTADEYTSSALKKGWLLKKSTNNLVKKWLNRYFTLENCRLLYFHSESDKRQKGVFDFNQLTVASVNSTSKKFEIQITFFASDYILRLRAQNTEELSDWVLALNLNISVSLGMRKELTLVISKPKFWRYQRISDYFFRRHANTGDILLFRSKGVVAKFQRGFTRGEFDHIALIMCFASGKVILLEATDKDGVACLEWDYFIKMNWHLMYSRLVYRSLETIRTEEMIRKLEKFVKTVDGKKFGIGPGKFIRNTNVEPGEENNFFCSELVASAFKAMGVFQNNFKSSSLWPADFLNDQKLPFANGCFGQEMLIDFDL
jgi:hypothetical protein